MCKDLERGETLEIFFYSIEFAYIFFSLICCACLILELLKAQV